MRLAFAPAARAAALDGTGGIIHFEIQAKNVNKIVEAQIPVLGDVVASLAELVPQIKPAERTAWIERCRANKERYPFAFTGSTEGSKLKPQEVVQELDRQADVLGSECDSTYGVHDIDRSRGECACVDWCWTTSDVGVSALPMERTA